jgi:hypothetical protein
LVDAFEEKGMIEDGKWKSVYIYMLGGVLLICSYKHFQVISNGMIRAAKDEATRAVERERKAH